MAFFKVILVMVLAFVSIPEARSSAQARSEQSALHDDTIPRQVIGPNTKLNHALGNNQEASSLAQPRNVENAPCYDTIMDLKAETEHLKRQNLGLKTNLEQALRNNQEASCPAQPRNVENALHDDAIKDLKAETENLKTQQIMELKTKLRQALMNNQEASSSAQSRNVGNSPHDDAILDLKAETENLKRQNMGLKTKLKQALRSNKEASSPAQPRNVENALHDDAILDLKAETENLKGQIMELKTKLKQALKNNQACIQGAWDAANHVNALTNETNCYGNLTDTPALVSGEFFRIPDCAIAVSSRYEFNFDGYCGRINSSINPTCHLWATWVPLVSDTDPWIEATFLPLARFVVTAITTRGVLGYTQFVTEYKLGFRINEDIVPYFNEEGDYKIFARPLQDEIIHDLDPFIVYARSIILFPVRWTGSGSTLFYFAWEIHGYPMVE